MKMSFNPLYNFISPVTGRVLADSNYILIGNNQGIAIPSPILIDMRLDLLELRHEIDNIETLSNLPQNLVWIGDVNNKPQPTNLIPWLMPQLPLASNQLFMGNSSGIATQAQTITINNLPTLGVVTELGLPIPIGAGKIWRGTTSGRPEESDALSEAIADLLLVNARFGFANFIMGHGNLVLKTLMYGSQFLDTLDTGILKNTTGVLSRALPGVDYGDVSCPEESPTAGLIPIWSAGGGKNLVSSSMNVLNNNSITNVDTIELQTLKTTNYVRSPQLILSNDNASNNYVSFKNPSNILGIVVWTLPNTPGTAGQVLTNIDGGGGTLSFMNILPANLQNSLLAQGTDASGNPVIQNATLTSGKIWVGDSTNKPTETDPNYAPNDASYILKTPNDALVNAQALSALTGGILKSTTVTGVLSNAVPGVDYATQAAVSTAQTTATEAATAAAAAPAAGAALAASYFAAQMLPYLPSPIPLTGPGTQITAAIAVAAALGAAAQITASGANTRIDNLTVTLGGDIIGTNNIANQIITEFAPNPTLPGNAYVRIPVGDNSQRPGESLAGMMRFNTDLT